MACKLLNVHFLWYCPGSSRFQPGEGPSRGLLRDYEPSDGTFSSTSPHSVLLAISIRTYGGNNGIRTEQHFVFWMSAGLISMQRQTVTINVQVFKGTNLIHDDHECIQLIIQWMNSETFFRIQIFLVFLRGWMKRHFSGYILLREVNIYLKLFFPHPTHKILTPLIDDDAINVSWNFV